MTTNHAQKVLEGFDWKAKDGSFTPEEIETIRAALRIMAGQEYLCNDDQEQAVWQAIKDIEIGNETDDKLIVGNLHKRGYVIVKISPQAAQEEG